MSWLLDPNVTYLNHGAFGACPREVLDVQHAWRERLEREPIRFFVRDLERELDAVRQVLGAFLGAEPADLAFVANATVGVNTALASFAFAPGDEVLITDHGYNACSNAAQSWAERAGARVNVARVPFPTSAPDVVIDAIRAALTPRTRLALLDHVTSPTGLIFPIEHAIAELKSRGIRTLVDGAHSPGMLPLNLDALGADYYTGNFHKWCCAPKGAAFLWVRRELQSSMRPLVVSHGANSTRSDRSRFLLEFDWTGTSDVTAVLAVPAALAFLDKLAAGGLQALRARNHALAVSARTLLCEVLETESVCPESMLGSLAAVLLPESAPNQPTPQELYDRLEQVHHIQVPIMPWPGYPSGFLRIAAQAYNDLGQYRKLGTALRAELGLG